jgi:hypothetical protein
MGEAQSTLFEPDFNRAIKVHATDERITSDAGALLLREADHRLGLIESLSQRIADPRDPDKVRYTLCELLRERLYALALGYQAQDDLDRLAHDPAMRMAVWDRPGQKVLGERLASQPTQSRLVELLAKPGHREALRDSLCDWTHRHLRATGGDHAVRRATIDIDSFPITVHGQQQGGRYNGYYRDTVYHPLVASFSVGGDYDGTRVGLRLGSGFLHAVLRQGQVHAAQGAKRFVRKVIAKARPLARYLDARIDAGMMHGELLDELTDQNVRFCGRLKANPVLQRMAEGHIYRLPGRPPAEGYEYTVELGMYQAAGWRYAYRLILVVVDRPDTRTGQLNLMPHYFFLLASWTEEERSAQEVLDHYRGRGTFEDRLGEFQQTIGSHLSSLEFVNNEVTLLLILLAYNLASLLRIELEDDLGGCWDLSRFQKSVLKAGGKVVKRSNRLWLYVARCVQPFWERLAARLRRFRLPARWCSPRGARRRAWVRPPAHAHLTLVLRH